MTQNNNIEYIIAVISEHFNNIVSNDFDVITA